MALCAPCNPAGSIDFQPKLTARRERLLEGDDFVRSSSRIWPNSDPCLEAILELLNQCNQALVAPYDGWASCCVDSGQRIMIKVSLSNCTSMAS